MLQDLFKNFVLFILHQKSPKKKVPQFDEKKKNKNNIWFHEFFLFIKYFCEITFQMLIDQGHLSSMHYAA